MTNLLNKINCRLEVKTKVNKVPLNAFLLVLLLLQDEHGVVKQLLELLIGVVDTQLLKGVDLQTQEKVINPVMLLET